MGRAADKTPEQVLRSLVDLARRANSSKTAIRMDDVFDNPEDAHAWEVAWQDARAIVAHLN